MTAKTRRKIVMIIGVTMAGMLIGPLFANIVFGFAWFRIVKGMLVGFLIMSASATVETFFFERTLRRLGFSTAVLVRTVFYVVLISFSTITVVVVHEGMEHGRGVLETLRGEELAEFFHTDFLTILLASIVISGVINTFWQMNLLLGRGVLLKYLTGRYHAPREEECIVMFLDVKSSTTIAEGIHPLMYHRLLTEYFYDINEPILESGGEIYQYVGDEVVIQWPVANGVRDAQCVRCFFAIRDTIDRLREKYNRTFGMLPGFKAGLHCGKVVVGEVGDSKRDIVYHGDVMNTAARIQAQCNEQRADLLASSDLLERLQLGDEFRARSIGTVRLKGKQREVELFRIDRTIEARE